MTKRLSGPPLPADGPFLAASATCTYTLLPCSSACGFTPLSPPLAAKAASAKRPCQKHANALLRLLRIYYYCTQAGNKTALHWTDLETTNFMLDVLVYFGYPPYTGKITAIVYHMKYCPESQQSSSYSSCLTTSICKGFAQFWSAMLQLSLLFVILCLNTPHCKARDSEAIMTHTLATGVSQLEPDAD